MAQESLGTDINGKVDFSLPIPVACADTTLTATVEQHVTAPPNFNRVFFSYAPGTNNWVALDGTTAAIPGSSFATSTQELNPSVRQIPSNGTTVISVISDTASYVNIRFDLGTHLSNS